MAVVATVRLMLHRGQAAQISSLTASFQRIAVRPSFLLDRRSDFDGKTGLSKMLLNAVTVCQLAQLRSVPLPKTSACSCVKMKPGVPSNTARHPPRL